MFPELANSARLFGSIYFGAALLMLSAAIIATTQDKTSATNLAKGFFFDCIVVALLLWVFAWLIN